MSAWFLLKLNVNYSRYYEYVNDSKVIDLLWDGWMTMTSKLSTFLIKLTVLLYIINDFD